MKKRIWHSGPPPHVGWWNASIGYHNNNWRWWNGIEWSMPSSEKNSSKIAAVYAGFEDHLDTIQWTYYYPVNARVPRVKS